MEHTDNHCPACFQQIDRVYAVLLFIAIVTPIVLGLAGFVAAVSK